MRGIFSGRLHDNAKSVEETEQLRRENKELRLQIKTIRDAQMKIIRELYSQFGITLDQSGSGRHMMLKK